MLTNGPFEFARKPTTGDLPVALDCCLRPPRDHRGFPNGQAPKEPKVNHFGSPLIALFQAFQDVVH